MRALIDFMIFASAMFQLLIGVIAFNGWEHVVLNPNVNKEYMFIGWLIAFSSITTIALMRKR